MKRYIALSIAFLGAIFMVSCSSQKSMNEQIQIIPAEQMIIGEFAQSALTKGKYTDWYMPEYAEYEVEAVKLKGIENKVSDYTIETFVGTWCADSKRELPRLYKILGFVNYPIAEQMKVYGVNREKKTDKGEELGKNITHVPTIIFYKDGKEVGRIVESPVTGYLEEDIAMIVKGTPLTPNYN